MFSICMVCNEITYAIPTNNGVYNAKNMSNNHMECEQKIIELEQFEKISKKILDEIEINELIELLKTNY